VRQGRSWGGRASATSQRLFETGYHFCAQCDIPQRLPCAARPPPHTHGHMRHRHYSSNASLQAAATRARNLQRHWQGLAQAVACSDTKASARSHSHANTRTHAWPHAGRTRPPRACCGSAELRSAFDRRSRASTSARAAHWESAVRTRQGRPPVCSRRASPFSLSARQRNWFPTVDHLIGAKFEV